MVAVVALPIACSRGDRQGPDLGLPELAALAPERFGVELVAVESSDYPQLDGPARVRVLRAERSVASLLASHETTAAELGEELGRLGIVQHAYGALDAATISYRNAASMLPDDGRWHHLAGLALTELQRQDEAVAAFEQAVARSPDQLASRLALADLVWRRGESERAEQLWSDVLARQPSSAAALCGLGEAAQLAGEHVEAIDLLQRCLQEDPGATRAHHPLAMSHRALGDVESARRHLQLQGERSAVFADPLRAQLLAVHPEALARAGARSEGAGGLAALRRAVRARPSDPVIRHNYAVALGLAGRHDEAIGEFGAASRLGLDDGTLHRNLGLSLRALGRRDEALEAFRRGVAVDPGSPDLRRALAQELLAHGEVEAAIVELERALAIEPASPEVRGLLERARGVAETRVQRE